VQHIYFSHLLTHGGTLIFYLKKIENLFLRSVHLSIKYSKMNCDDGAEVINILPHTFYYLPIFFDVNSIVPLGPYILYLIILAYHKF